MRVFTFVLFILLSNLSVANVVGVDAQNFNPTTLATDKFDKRINKTNVKTLMQTFPVLFHSNV